MDITWTEDAEKRMERVPGGFMRKMAKRKVEKIATAEGVTEIDLEFAEKALAEAKKSMMGG